MKPRLALLGLGMAGMIVYDFLSPDAKSFQEPALARIMFWHLPSAMICTVLLFLSAYMAFRFLRSRDLKWDNHLSTTIELSTLFGVFVMATGILFSKVQWGEWWQWDPRQTSFMFVLVLMAMSLALRGGFADAKKRAAVSSAYALLSLLPEIFLIAVFPRLPEVQKVTFHPNQTLPNNQLDVPYKIGLYGTLVFLGWVALELYRMRVRTGMLNQRLEDRHGMDETDRSRAAVTGVVRPVGVSQDN